MTLGTLQSARLLADQVGEMTESQFLECSNCILYNGLHRLISKGIGLAISKPKE